MRVLVIGSGLLGLSTGYFLRRFGADVWVVDRSKGPGRETSFGNAGLLTPSMGDPWNAPGVLTQLANNIGRSNAPLLLRAKALPSLWDWGLEFLKQSSQERYDRNTLKNVRLALYSGSVLAELREQLELAFDYSASGTLRVFRDQGSWNRAWLRAAWLHGHGVHAQRLDARDTVAMEPALADIRHQLVGGIFSPQDAVGNSHCFCEALAAVMRKAGVTFCYDTPITGWRHAGGRAQVALTTSRALGAEAFVLAAGHSSRELARSLGFDLPLRPVKGYSITLANTALAPFPRVPVIDDSLHAAVTPIGSLLRAAGTAEFTGVDLSMQPARIDNLRRLTQSIYPRAALNADYAALGPWTGLRPVTADGVPLLGQTPMGNVYVNTGHGHLGWTMAAGSGKAVAGLITGRPAAIELADYALKR